MIEKHYGDARVDADQLDEMIGEFESATGNPTGNPPGRERRLGAVEGEGEGTLCALRGSDESGRPGRTGDVQLGKLYGPLWGKDFSAAVAEMG